MRRVVAAALGSYLIGGTALAQELRYEAPPVGSYSLPAIDRVRDHPVLGSDGKIRPLLGLSADEVAVVSFVYLSCTEACPLATSTLIRLDRELAKSPELAKHARLVTVSFDPDRDTPARMRKLREHIEPQSRWDFVTAADAGAIRPVLEDFGQDAVWVPQKREGPAPDLLRHVLKVFLVDAAGDIRNIYSTGYLDVRLVLNDLRTVLQDSGAVPRASPSHESTRSASEPS